MALQERHIEDFVRTYIKDKDLVAIGTSKLGETFLKKLALAMEDKKVNIWDIKFVPTSLHLAGVATSLKIPIGNLNEREVDIAIEFVDMIDNNFNYIKRNSLSLVRDKMIAQSAAILIAITEKHNFVKKLKGKIPFEICPFGWRRTINQLENLGKAKLRMEKGKPFRTETGHYLIDVDIDEIYSLDELEYQAKEVPGVLETGLFIGYADKIILHNKTIEVKSRVEFK